MPAGAGSAETKAQTKKDLNLIRLLAGPAGQAPLIGLSGIVAARIGGRSSRFVTAGARYQTVRNLEPAATRAYAISGMYYFRAFLPRPVLAATCLLIGAMAASAAPNSDQFSAFDRGYWAFQAVERPAPPETARGEAAAIDLFIAEKLAAQGLSMSPGADKRTLIRRASFDLVGLPPSPQEVEAFLADESPEAFAKVVDRLLESPHYGERWGRHWLDVARYADSNGLDENIAHGNAWRYRDYVVSSFSHDKPYDVFLVEQLAGDLLHAPADAGASRSTGHAFAQAAVSRRIRIGHRRFRHVPPNRKRPGLQRSFRTEHGLFLFRARRAIRFCSQFQKI